MAKISARGIRLDIPMTLFPNNIEELHKNIIPLGLGIGEGGE